MLSQYQVDSSANLQNIYTSSILPVTYDPIEIACLISANEKNPEKVYAFLDKKDSNGNTFLELLLQAKENSMAIQEYFKLLLDLHIKGIQIDNLVNLLKIDGIKQSLPFFPEYAMQSFLTFLNYALDNQNHESSRTLPIKIFSLLHFNTGYLLANKPAALIYYINLLKKLFLTGSVPGLFILNLMEDKDHERKLGIKIAAIKAPLAIQEFFSLLLLLLEIDNNKKMPFHIYQFILQNIEGIKIIDKIKEQGDPKTNLLYLYLVKSLEGKGIESSLLSTLLATKASIMESPLTQLTPLLNATLATIKDAALLYSLINDGYFYPTNGQDWFYHGLHSIADKKGLIFEYINKLPLLEKKLALQNALTPNHPLNDFFGIPRFMTSTCIEKGYFAKIQIELNNVNKEISQHSLWTFNPVNTSSYFTNNIFYSSAPQQTNQTVKLEPVYKSKDELEKIRKTR